jgi:Carboxypeptidase regulatory-like domain
MTHWRHTGKWRFAIALLEVWIIAGACRSLAKTSPNNHQLSRTTQAGKISGHVYRTDTGAPLAKANVTLRGSPQQDVPGTTLPASMPETTRTAPDGSFSFIDVAPGNYMIRVERTGYIGQFYGETRGMQTGTRVSVSAGQTVENIDFHLSAAGVISGTIYDEDNEPIEGMQVSAIQVRYSPGGRQREVTLRTTQTDDLGNYRLSGLTPGSYYVKTGVNRDAMSFGGGRGGVNYGARYYPGALSTDSAQRVQVTSGGEARGVQLSVSPEKTYSISGMILDATENSGQRRYTVIATRDVEASTEFATAVGATAGRPDCSFTLGGVPSGEYTLTARAIELNPQGGKGGPSPRVDVSYLSVRVTDGDARVNIQIGRASEVKGQAVLGNPPGPPITSFRVALQGQSLGGARGGPGGTSPDRDGMFDFKEVPAGHYSFAVQGGPQGSYLKRAICGGRDSTFQPITLEINSVLSDCSLTIATDAGTLSGQVMDSGKASAGLTVLVIPQSRELRQVARYAMTAITDGNGMYVITGVIPGDYYLFAVLPDEEQSYFALDYPERNQANAEILSVKPNESKTVNLKPTATQ